MLTFLLARSTYQGMYSSFLQERWFFLKSSLFIYVSFFNLIVNVVRLAVQTEFSRGRAPNPETQVFSLPKIPPLPQPLDDWYDRTSSLFLMIHKMLNEKNNREVDSNG